jgi:hypothetical protein
VLTLLGGLRLDRAGNDTGRTVLMGRSISAQNDTILSVGNGGLTLRADALTFAAGAQFLVSSGATSAAVFLRALDDGRTRPLGLRPVHRRGRRRGHAARQPDCKGRGRGCRLRASCHGAVYAGRRYGRFKGRWRGCR